MDDMQPTQSTDTDIANIREERAQSEWDLYRKLAEEFDDKSLVERVTEIREYIFDKYGNIKGDPVVRIRDRNVYSGNFSFIDHEELGPKYFPELVKKIDLLYEYIYDTKESFNISDNFDRLLRFASVVYSLGITIHPYIDGNGQTFRITAMTYLSEFFDKEFNFKENTKIRGSVPTDITDELPKTQPPSKTRLQVAKDIAYENLDAELQNIVQLRYKSPTDLESVVPHEFTELFFSMDISDPDSIEKVTSELHQAQSRYTGYIDYIVEIYTKYPEENFQDLADIYEFPFDKLIDSYDDIAISLFTHSQIDQVEELKKYLDAILIDPVGYRLLIDYIDGIKMEYDSGLHKAAAGSFERVFDQITKLANISDKFLGQNMSISVSDFRNKLSGKNILAKKIKLTLRNMIASLRQ